MAKEHYVATAKERKKKPLQKDLYYKPLVERPNCLLWHGDAKEFLFYLQKKNHRLHLVFTSPPYNVGINYGKHKDDLNWQEYLNWLAEIFGLCHSLLCPGGRVVLNVPHVVKFSLGKRYFPLADYQKILQKAGFDLMDLILWVKARDEKELFGVANRTMAWGSWKSPRAPIIRPVTEFLIVAKKQGEFQETSEPDISEEEFKSWTCSAWLIPTKSHPKHPAVFPEELVKRVIKIYSTPGQWILDPFMGIGTCGKVALALGRAFAGAEVEYEYFVEAHKIIGSNGDQLNKNS